MRISPIIVFFAISTIAILLAAQMDRLERDSRNLESFGAIRKDTPKDKVEFEKLKQENKRLEKIMQQKLDKAKSTGTTKMNP